MKKYLALFLTFITIFSIGLSEQSAFEKAKSDVLRELGSPEKTDKVYKVGALEITLANPFWVTMKEGFEASAKDFGFKIDVVAAPSEGDASAQLNYLETMLIKGYDALCISPINPFNLIPAVSKATQRKIPVIAVGTYVDEQAAKNAGAKINGMLAVDFEYQGRLPGQYIVEKFKGEKNVKVAIIEGIPGSAQSEGRKNGCISELAKSPNMKIVSVQPGNWDRTTALNVTSNLIQANPDLDVIFCANDTMALASVEALKAVGKKDQVMVIGCDFIEEAKESIEKGELDATLAMSPYLYGYIGGVMAYKTIINGNYTTDIQVPIKIVDKSNLKEYHDWK
ncbi:ribose transport system substrate-binding protein/D-allose transport system substrate-binding protein [Oceanotoga teriensis]|uniref:Ribose transport system substrate-binding protein/D-allose transport system substrate-binding protein n=1 Tax=Oceanotoga teriensis TaxID=515440 RepID=A0AA45C5J1_9BACT|nr:substrate-binding domain-containing protein [Oceanotoga teriensis]PWJ89021.1 ribose transport system substrate-binding protein/D-allose transport system substrate-binding protein [Oceanotoga teriensis]